MQEKLQPIAKENITLTIKNIIEQSDSKAGKLFDIAMQCLIILSLIGLSVETLPTISNKTKTLLQHIERITVIIFTIEYLLRIIVASNRLKFIFSFFGIIDLLAILPFYLSTGFDLRSLRLLRLLKLVRYSAAANRFHRAFIIAKEEIILFLIATFILLYLASVGIYYFEHTAQPEVFSSIFHSFWWSVVTLTTVGYGDAYPITVGGKAFTTLILVIGLGIVSVPAGLIASALSKTK